MKPVFPPQKTNHKPNDPRSCIPENSSKNIDIKNPYKLIDVDLLNYVRSCIISLQSKDDTPTAYCFGIMRSYSI